MRQTWWALALSISVAQAFRDTSPFFLISTSELLTSSPSLVNSYTLRADVESHLLKCPSDAYIIVSQPGVNAVDFHGQEKTPNLAGWVSGQDKHIRSSFVAQDVKGLVSAVEFRDVLQKRCNAQPVRQDVATSSMSMNDDSNPQVISLDFPALPTGNGRAAALKEHDAVLGRVVDILPSDRYTIIYTTTPSNTQPQRGHSEPEQYEMDSPLWGSPHVELKRDLSHNSRRAGDDPILRGPLFEKYQFFTPGLFAGLLAGFLLLSILYIGISALASLQISYAAFDKEIGLTAQKAKVQ